jgi:iron complex transport system permease protein
MSAVIAPSPGRRAGARLALAVTAMLAATAGLAFLNLARGTPSVGPGDVWRALADPAAPGENQARFLIRDLRAPRVLLAIGCGAALGVAGVLLQDALRNPLADPSLLGVAQGASFVVALVAIYPELAPPVPRPVLCLVAGGLTGVAVVGLSGSIRDPVRVVLTGAVLAAFLATLTTIVVLLAPYGRTGGISGYIRFVTGSVSAAEWSQVRMVAPWLAVGLPSALLAGRALNLLQLGDDLAAGVGLNPFRTRLLLIALAMVLIAPVIAAIGPVAFVALFAPHIARGLLRTSDARQVLVASALAGMTLLLAADTVGRLLFFPIEIPAGAWTIAMVGPAALVVAGRLRKRAER